MHSKEARTECGISGTQGGGAKEEFTPTPQTPYIVA